MIKEVTITADTIEEALKQAREKLGSEDIKSEIIQQPEKKKFGLFGGSPAKVRAFINVDDDILDNTTANYNSPENSGTQTMTISEDLFADEEKSTPAAENMAETSEEKTEVSADYNPAQEAKAYIERVLEAMGLDEIIVEMTEEENAAELRLSGDQVGAVIGRRGETLDSLQYLAGLVANHTGNSYFRITINTGNYREKREKTLEVLGRKLAFKVLKTGRNVSLEPMNPYERRIIHTAVQKVNGVISWSEGEVINRHVVIGPDPEYKRNYRSGGYNSRGGRKNYGTGYDKKKSYNKRKFSSSDNFSTEHRKTEREPKNEGEKFSLYGRVDTKK